MNQVVNAILPAPPAPGGIDAAIPFIIPDDIKSAALPVLRHRVQLTPEVAIGGQDVDDILRAIIEAVPAPRN